MSYICAVCKKQEGMFETMREESAAKDKEIAALRQELDTFKEYICGKHDGYAACPDCVTEYCKTESRLSQSRAECDRLRSALEKYARTPENRKAKYPAIGWVSDLPENPWEIAEQALGGQSCQPKE